MEPTTYPLSAFQTLGYTVSPNEIIQPASGAVHVDNEGTGLDKLMAIAAMVADRQDGAVNQMVYKVDAEVSSPLANLSIPDKTFTQMETVSTSAGSKKTSTSAGSKKTSKKKSPSKPRKRRRTSPPEEYEYVPKRGRPRADEPRRAGKKVSPCEQCDRTFSCPAKLREHVRIIHDNVMLQCEICNATMKWSNNMTIHMYTKHGMGEAPKKKVIMRECQRCRIKFASNKKLYDHMEIVHKSYEHFKCQVCMMTFKNQSTLFQHKKTHTKLGFYRCGTCHLRYNSKVMMTKHTKQYDHKFDDAWYTKDELSFECYRCDKIYENYAALSHHVTAANQYKDCVVRADLRCHECKIQFKDRKQFRKHMKDVHKKKIPKIQNGKKGNPKECKICGKVLSWRTEMKYHINMHKGIKNFKCDLCDYASYFPSSVRQHKKTHFGEMNHFCRTCGKGFKSRALWRACEFMHTGKQPIECKGCGLQFISDEAYKTHKCNKDAKTTESADNKEGNANKITNQSLLHMMMRGGKMAESVDDSAIADFKKPKKPKHMKIKIVGKRVKEEKQSKSSDEDDVLENIDSLEASDPCAEDIAQLEQIIQSIQNRESSDSQTMANSASSEQMNQTNKTQASSDSQTASSDSPEQMKQTTQSQATSDSQTAINLGSTEQINQTAQSQVSSDSQTATSSISSDSKDKTKKTEIENNTNSHSSDQACGSSSSPEGTIQKSPSKSDNGSESNEPSTSVKKVSTIGRQAKKFNLKSSLKRWNALRDPGRKRKLTKEQLMREFEKCDWREKTYTSFIHWKEVSLEEVVESVNTKIALKQRQKPADPNEDIFDDIVFE